MSSPGQKLTDFVGVLICLGRGHHQWTLFIIPNRRDFLQLDTVSQAQLHNDQQRY